MSLDRWTHHHGGRALVVEVTGDPVGAVRITGRYVDMELTVHELEWFLLASGPAALARIRQDRGEPAPVRRSPMVGSP